VDGVPSAVLRYGWGEMARIFWNVARVGNKDREFF